VDIFTPGKETEFFGLLSVRHSRVLLKEPSLSEAAASAALSATRPETPSNVGNYLWDFAMPHKDDD
jgi:hypothetical protein